MEENSIMKEYLGELNRMRLEDRLTDFSICVGGELMRVHKIVLAAHSDFFKAMFNNDSSELRDGLVKLEEVDPEAMKIIVEFWYTNNMKMTDENISSLLSVASRIQAKTALRVCLLFAEANLTPTNCLRIFLLSDRCNFAKLREQAFMYCLEKFDDIQITDLWCLDQEFFTRIISNDELDVKNEINVFKAIMSWVQHDAGVRSTNLEDLMREVRFESIDPVSLVELRVAKLDDIFEPYRVKAMEILLLKKTPELYGEYVGKFNSKRRRPASTRRLYVLGGMTSGNQCSIDCEIYDPNTDKWSCLQAMYEPIEKDHVLAFSDFIYAPSSDGLAFQYYNFDTNRWFLGDRHVCDKPSKLLIALGEHIYSFSALNHPGYLTLLSKYDLKGNEYFCEPSQPPRKKFQIAVDNRFIYLIGGMIDEKFTNSVQRYDSQKNTWEKVAPMKRPLHSFGCCSYNGKIYVAGGCHTEGCLTTYMRECEVYDPELNTWTSIASAVLYTCHTLRSQPNFRYRLIRA